MPDGARVADLTDDELAACIADPGAFVARGDRFRQPIARWGVSAIRVKLASMPAPSLTAGRIEAAAIALHGWHAGPGEGKWAAATDATRATFRDQASAALAAAGAVS